MSGPNNYRDDVLTAIGGHLTSFADSYRMKELNLSGRAL